MKLSLLQLTFVLTITCINPFAQASSVYIGYSQTEQNTLISNRTLAFSPKGASTLVAIDVTDNWSVNFDYSRLRDSQSLANTANGDLDIDSWGVGITYYLRDWSFSFSHSDWQDELIIVRKNGSLIADQETESPSQSITVSYDWYYGNWQTGLSAGLHSSDWQQQIRGSSRPEQQQSAVDKGNSTFVSMSASAAKIIDLYKDVSIIVGGSLSWNHLTNSESEAVSRNGRNISQISNRVGRSLNTNTGITGTESYGQLNLYVSYDLTKALSIDLDGSFDLGGDENTQAWSVNLGYIY